MTHWRRSPRPAGLALDAVRDEWAPETLLAEAQRVWLAAVGPVIAGEARPTAERAGVLTISCAASVWAQELELMGPEIVERLNAELTRGSVARLRCISLPVR